MVKRELIESDPESWALQEIAELEVLGTALVQFAEVLAVFGSDLDIYKEIAAADERPFWGRTIIRSLFAGIEGLCYCQKQAALATAVLKNIDLTNAELAIAREEHYGLNDTGEAESRKSKLRTAPNIAFALRILARARGGRYELDTNSPGWQALKKSIRVRDRVTHPKDAGDLQVTKDELLTMLSAASWFLSEHGVILQRTPIPATPDASGK